MIPKAFVDAWRSEAPWQSDAQVEQDLVLSRAIIEIFANEALRSKLAFRGGTALHKLYLHPARRYSEDIDLVQMDAEPIGVTLDILRSVLDPWLGTPKRKLTDGRVVLSYRFEAEGSGVPLRLKVEINSREHFSVLGYQEIPFELDTPWFSGQAKVVTFDIHELLGTKLRALYQRRKGRDLFDLAQSISLLDLNKFTLIRCFAEYLSKEGIHVSRSEFEANLVLKRCHPDYSNDMLPLVAPHTHWDVTEAFDLVMPLVRRVPGEGWESVDEESRNLREYEKLLEEAERMGYSVFRPYPYGARGGLGYLEGERLIWDGPNFILEQVRKDWFTLHFFVFHRLGIEEFEGTSDDVMATLLEAKAWYLAHPPKRF